MAVDIIATIGGATANSYATLAEADAYFSLRPNSTAWTVIVDDDERAKLLLWAMRSLDGLGWIGIRVNSTQSLDWPRRAIRPAERNAPFNYGAYTPTGNGLYDLRGQFHATTTIPQGVKAAQCEIALASQVSSVLTTPEKYKKRVITDKNGTLEYNTGAQSGTIISLGMAQLSGLLLTGAGISLISK